MADLEYTPNIRLVKPPGNRMNWTELVNGNWTVIDAMITAYFAVANLRGPWANSTSYAVGDAVVDSSTAVIWQNDVAHISSSSPGTFLQERTANPSYWIPYSAPARYRGAWARDTTYRLNDFVVSGTKYAVCSEAHTSGSSFDVDAAAGKWSILIDLSSVVSNVMPAPTGIADAGKFAVINGAGTGYTLVDALDALALLGATSIGQAVLLAVSQSDARDALDAQRHSTVLDMLAATSPGAFGLAMLGAANEEAANSLIIRDQRDIESFVALNGLPRDYARVNMNSYYDTDVASGGGMLIHDPSSSATVDDGVTFAAIVGRYRRLINGFLTTDDFGIKKGSGAGDMSAQMQKFLNACWNEKCTAVISASTSALGIDCNGATLYINTDGTVTGAAPSGFTMRGEHARQSMLNNCLLSIGAVGTITGSGNAAGKVSFSGWYHTGAIHCWNLQTGPEFSTIRIVPDSTLLPAYEADYPGVDWNFGFLASQCNHMQLYGVRVEPSTGCQGAFFTGAGNYQWIGGGVQGMLRGVVARADAVLPGASGVAKISLRGLHFESILNECFVMEDVDQVNIIDNHIRGNLVAHAGVSLIRIGDAADSSSGCQNVVITQNWSTGINTQVDTVVDIQRCLGISVYGNRFQSYAVGVTTLNSPGSGFPVTGFSEYDNQYVSVVDNVLLADNTQLKQGEAESIRPITLSPSTLAWNMSTSPNANLSITGAGKTMPNPTNFVVGKEYTLYLTKTFLVNSITTWGSMYAFTGFALGAGPDFSTMAVAQFAELTLKCVDVGGTVYLSTTYAIRGT